MVVQPRRAGWGGSRRDGSRPQNLSALADLSGQWIDKVHRRRPPRGVVLDMDSSVSPTHGKQELIPRLVDQDPWAQLRRPMDMIRQG